MKYLTLTTGSWLLYLIGKLVAFLPQLQALSLLMAIVASGITIGTWLFRKIQWIYSKIKNK